MKSGSITIMNRRQFLLWTAAVVSGCQSADHSSTVAAPGPERLIDAGPVNGFAADGVYTRFREQGFFIVRQGEKLFALSSYCTHRKCKLTAEADHSFHCKCHGSNFDPSGKVTEGPARRDLPVLPTVTDEKGELKVTVPVG